MAYTMSVDPAYFGLALTPEHVVPSSDVVAARGIIEPLLPLSDEVQLAWAVLLEHLGFGEWLSRTEFERRYPRP